MHFTFNREMLMVVRECYAWCVRYMINTLRLFSRSYPIDTWRPTT